MIEQLRNISALLTKTANAPMQDAAYALHTARRQLTDILLTHDREQTERILNLQKTAINDPRDVRYWLDNVSQTK
jgi:hypothetical protein